MPEKVTIAYRGAKYEIGRGKRYYGIWVADAPASDPIDRWPENRDGWVQAWARFSAIETPGTISQVGKPRAGFKLAGFKLPVRKRGMDTVPRPGRPGRATVGAGMIGFGVLLGLIGLFPGYVLSSGASGSQSLASSAEQLVPHLIYLVTWAVSGAAIALGALRAAGSRFEILRLGALLGCGLSAVTFGLFSVDVGQVIAGGSAGAGLVLTLLGWLGCAAGSLLALFARPRVPALSAQSPQAESSATAPSPAAQPPAGPSAAAQPPDRAGPSPAGPTPAEPSPAAPTWPVEPSPAASSPAAQSSADAAPAAPAPPGQSPAAPAPPGQSPAAPAPPGQSPEAAVPAEPPPAAPTRVGPTFAWPSPATPTPPPSSWASPAPSRWPSQATSPWPAPGRPAASGAPSAIGRPARPRAADAGPITLILLAAIGAVAAFAPAWDSLTFTQAGVSHTITQGNAFAVPGAMIAGNVATMVAVIAVAVLAALWRPVRHGAMLLAGATVPLAAQAISALIQANEPVSAATFGISASDGVTITSGVTPIFWVYCVFVISLVVSCAWMLTAPRYPAMPAASHSPAPGPVHVHAAQGVDDEDDDSDDDDAEDDAKSTYA